MEKVKQKNTPQRCRMKDDQLVGETGKSKDPDFNQEVPDTTSAIIVAEYAMNIHSGICF